MNKRAFLKMAVRSMALVGVAGLHASNTVWLGATNNGDTPSNWSNGIPNNNIAEYNGASGNSETETINGFSASGFLFDSSVTQSFYIFNDASGTISIGSDGVVNNSSYTQGIANDSSSAGLVILSNCSAGSNVAYTSFNANPGGGITLYSVDGSQSSFYCESGSTLTINGECSVGTITTSFEGDIVLNPGSQLTTGGLIDNQDDYMYGTISGEGALIFANTGNFGYLGLYVPCTYTGGTVLNALGGGELYTFGTGTFPLNGPITVNSGTIYFGNSQPIGTLSGTGGSFYIEGVTVTINQTNDATYAGTLQSNSGSVLNYGTVGSSTAVSTLQLTGDSSSFNAAVAVNSGNLQVNNNLGASGIVVNNGATLSGTGTVGSPGALTTIASGGILSPGNSVGVMTNAGSQTFLTGSIYRLEENGFTTGPVTPSIDLLIVDQTATVDNNAIVNLVTTDGNINFNTKQVFLTSGNPLVVNGNGFIVNTALLTPPFNPDAFEVELSHDAHNYYILTQTQFTNEIKNAGGNAAAQAVGRFFDSLSDPTTAQNLFMNGLAKLSANDLITDLSLFSGAQFVTEAFITEVSNRQFIRRLYDPIRERVTTVPCGCYCGNSEGWFEAGGGQKRVNGPAGVRVADWDVTLGFQTNFLSSFVLGVAGSYENHEIQYNRGHGHGNGYCAFGGIYGLYRPRCFYVLADLAYGYTQHRLHRDFTFVGLKNSYRSNPTTSQVTFYAESGFDLPTTYINFQPFFGIEAGGFFRNSFREQQIVGTDLGLELRKEDRSIAVSSLGVHVTDRLFCDFFFSLDLAWLYRLTDDVYYTGNFELLPLSFPIYGERIGRSSGQGALTFTKYFTDNFKSYVVASGEIWDRASAWNVEGGLQFTW